MKVQLNLESFDYGEVLQFLPPIKQKDLDGPLEMDDSKMDLLDQTLDKNLGLNQT